MNGRSSSRRTHGAWCVALAYGLLAGCSTPAHVGAEAEGPTRRIGLVDPDGPLGLASDGLAVRELRVGDDDAAVASALAAHTEPALDEGADARLARNGLRVRSTSVENLPLFVDAIGPAASDIEGWYGQVHAWQAVRTVPVTGNGRALAVDGRVQRIAGGRMELLLRGWTLPMEQGPRFQLELVPRHAHGARSRLAAVLHAESDAGDRIRGGGVDLLLEMGRAYVVTYLPPLRVLGAGDDPGPAPVDDALPRDIGPEAAAPVTLGELLFREHHDGPPAESAGASMRLLGLDGQPLDLPADATRQGQRRVLILVPRIPAYLVPEPRA